MADEQDRLALEGDALEPQDDDEKLERWKDRLLAAAHAEHPEAGIQRRVAWLMNRYPHTRDSDVGLQLAYWEHFDDMSSDTINVEDLYRLTKLTSVDRARRAIQNSLGLFQASDEIKRMRTALGAEHRVRDRRPDVPSVTVYADEAASGRRGHLIVAGVWVFDDEFRVSRAIREWKERKGIEHEFHFTEAKRHQLPNYLGFIDLVAENSEFIGLTALSVEEPATGRLEALERLYTHMFRTGLEKAVSSGRMRLPRLLKVVKDLDDRGRDKLLLAEVKARLRTDSELFHGGQLFCDDFVAVPSAQSALVQVADLYAASLNRLLNEERHGNHKDSIADHFLSAMNYSPEAAPENMTVHDAL